MVPICVNRCHSIVMWNAVHSLIALIFYGISAYLTAEPFSKGLYAINPIKCPNEQNKYY